MYEDQDWEFALSNVGAIQKWEHPEHVELSSGLHSDLYVDMWQAYSDPQLYHSMCAELLKKAGIQGITHDTWFIGPANGGIPLAFDLALQTRSRAAFATKSSSSPFGLELKYFYLNKEPKKVIITEDVITTGRAVERLWYLLISEGYDPNPMILALVNRGGKEALRLPTRYDPNTTWPIPIVSVISINSPGWNARTCRLCREESVAKRF